MKLRIITGFSIAAISCFGAVLDCLSHLLMTSKKLLEKAIFEMPPLGCFSKLLLLIDVKNENIISIFFKKLLYDHSFFFICLNKAQVIENRPSDKDEKNNCNSL